MTARVIAFPGVTLTARETETPDPPPKVVTTMQCPACGYGIRDDEFEVWHCTRCDARLHGPCYWGRIAPLAEWLEYLRRVCETDDEQCSRVVCAACRQGEGRGKEGA